MGQTVRAWSLALTLAAGVGCASVRPPGIEVLSVRVGSLGLSGGELTVGLELSNPNGRDITLRRVDYSLDVAAAGDGGWLRVGEAAYDDEIELPANGIAAVDVALPFTYRALGGAIGSLIQTGGVEYRAAGQVVADGWLGDLTVPFSSTGRLDPFSVGDSSGQPVPGHGPDPPMMQPQEGGPVVTPRAGRAGTRVTVGIENLLEQDAVLVGFGGIGSPHEILGEGVADGEGVVILPVTIPDWVEPNRTYLFYMAWADQRPVAFSSPFLVTDPDGEVTLAGVLTDEGVTCPALRGEDGTLFTLAGDTAGLAVGQSVRVRARVAEVSNCLQGITLEVLDVAVLP